MEKITADQVAGAKAQGKGLEQKFDVQNAETAALAARMKKLEAYEASVARSTEKANRKVAHDKLMVAKAIAANITVSEAEIDAYMNAKRTTK